MAISDVKEYTHLTEEQVEELGRELDAIRTEIEESRGAADAAYINRMIRIQRALAIAGRVTLLAGTQFKETRKPALVLGAGSRALGRRAATRSRLGVRPHLRWSSRRSLRFQPVRGSGRR